MRPYELVVLLHPDLEIDIDNPTKKLEGIIKGVGGEIKTQENWGKKRLAYPVKKHDFAVYVYFELLIDPLKVRPLEDQLLITEEVLRHLLTKAEEQPKKDKKPKPAAKPKAEEEDVKEVATAVAEEGK